MTKAGRPEYPYLEEPDTDVDSGWRFIELQEKLGIRRSAQSMGDFYTNYTIRGPSQQDVANALAGRNAVVTPAHNGCVVAFDEQSDEQDREIIAKLASRLSGKLRCPVLAVLNHDDDILWYQIYENGNLTDEYDSSPGYFDPEAEPCAPVGGDAQRLCVAFGVSNTATVESVLRKSSYDEEGYASACERHADLLRALGLPECAVGWPMQVSTVTNTRKVCRQRTS